METIKTAFVYGVAFGMFWVGFATLIVVATKVMNIVKTALQPKEKT